MTLSNASKVANILMTYKTISDLNFDIKNICKKLNIETPRLVDIIASIPKNHKILNLIRSKPVRTASGVAIVAIMCKPHRCPHIALTGNICVYCPGGPDSDFEYSTQSYTGYEPTSMRAIRARYSPYEQIINRIDQLKQLGHSTEKVEVIIMGGTFLSLNTEYKRDFIKNIYDALSKRKSTDLNSAKIFNMKSKQRLVGLTIESRPDFAQKRHLNELIEFGCTRLEIGMQSVYEDVARDTNRGHSVLAVRSAFEWAKDCGFKMVAHMMPNLPNVSLERDYAQFVEFFSSPKYRTDGLKIYPTLVIRQTGLYELWKNKKYLNYEPDVLVELLCHILKDLPPWIRIYRIQRDIPMPLVTAGVEYGNLRQVIEEKCKSYGFNIRDIRSREVGIKKIQKKEVNKVSFVRRDYFANKGWETFLTYEDVENDILIGMCRLRKLNKPFRNELKGASMIRELHVYGTALPIHVSEASLHQHKGYGTLLLQEAERITQEEHGNTRLAIISGVGVREYYRAQGYFLLNDYMIKNFF